MHIETKIIYRDRQVEIKTDEVNGTRRTPKIHLLLTEAESRQFNHGVENLMYAIHANRAALTIEEREKLPQPEAKGKKQEVME